MQTGYTARTPAVITVKPVPLGGNLGRDVRVAIQGFGNAAQHVLKSGANKRKFPNSAATGNLELPLSL